MFMFRKVFAVFTGLLIVFGAIGLAYGIFIHLKNERQKPLPPFLEVNTAWADTVLSKMSTKQKIAQMVIFKLDKAKIDEKKDLLQLLKKMAPGGILFTNTDISTQLILTHASLSATKIPLLIASEGAVINQKDFNFPAGMFLGACQDTVFRTQYIKAFAEILAKSSVNIDFTASLQQYDKCHNSMYFFSDNNLVNFELTTEWNRCLNDENVIACINGADLKMLNETDSSALAKQFRSQIKNFHALSFKQTVLPDTLNRLLNSKFKFKGLLFFNKDTLLNDSILANMIKSGINLFVIDEQPDTLIKKIKRLLKKGIITEKQIDENVRTILLAKTWFNLNRPVFRSAEYRLQKIFIPENKKLSWQIYEKTATVIKNKNQVLPLNCKREINAAFYSSNKKDFQILKNSIRYYFDFPDTNTFILNDSITYLIMAIQTDDSTLLNDNIFREKLLEMSKQTSIIVLNFATPLYIKEMDFANAVIQLYDIHPFSQSIAAQIICGAVTPSGKLPVYQIE